MRFVDFLFEDKTDYVIANMGKKLVDAARTNDFDFYRQLVKGKQVTPESEGELAKQIVLELLKIDPKYDEDIHSKHDALKTELDKLFAEREEERRRTREVRARVDDLKDRDDQRKVLASLIKSPDGKYLVWAARMYASKFFKMEDIPRIRSEILAFELHKKDLPNKDLNAYRSLNDLYKAIDQFVERKDEDEDDDGVEWIIKSKYYKALIPRTMEAAKKWGKNTRWCTAWEKNNQFDSYAKQGDLVIIIAKIGNEANEYKYGPSEGTWRKFQFHFETHSFMDENDLAVRARKKNPDGSMGPAVHGWQDVRGLSKHPEHKQLLQLLLTKYNIK
jgi:hypothetical protein